MFSFIFFRLTWIGSQFVTVVSFGYLSFVWFCLSLGFGEENTFAWVKFVAGDESEL
tara:strand:+ start:295 stop:462 length:168 start_codon:yes stop_codon:yes gene_type:complete